jgi:hypothetical protein
VELWAMACGAGIRTGRIKGPTDNGSCLGQPNGLKCLSSPTRSPRRAKPGPASIRAVPGSCRAKKRASCGANGPRAFWTSIEAPKETTWAPPACTPCDQDQARKQPPFPHTYGRVTSFHWLTICRFMFGTHTESVLLCEISCVCNHVLLHVVEF